MGKTVLFRITAASLLSLSLLAACGDDATDDNGNAGTGGSAGTNGGDKDGGGGGGGGGDDINPACPMGVKPITGEFAPKGECCYRSANSSRVEEQGDSDMVTVEYRLNYVQTENHDKTIGNDTVRMISQSRGENEEQSVLWRFTGPRKDGKAISGKGTVQIGTGRYNCDGTYSFYSDKAAPMTTANKDPARWKSRVVPVTIDASITDPKKAELRSVPDFAKNANRGYTYTPYVDMSTFDLDWELVNQGFTIENIPNDEEALDCVGKYNSDTASGWTGGGTFIVYTPLDKNNAEPIVALGGQTYCQLVAFGFGIAKDDPAYSCSQDAKRCAPGSAGCKWVKLPDSLCPTTDEDQAKWGCHIGDEKNVDNEPTSCTKEAPTGVLDPSMGATSKGQCCDPLATAASGLPACNAYFLRNEFVAAAADITDDEADELQPDCP